MPHAWRYEYYCEGCASTAPVRLVPAKEFCKQHFISVDQLNTLLRRRALIAKKFKGRNYVAVNPVVIQEGQALADFL
jgi:hypothetical protein